MIEEECPICFETVAIPERVVKFSPCRHWVCRMCAHEVLSKSGCHCPMCRGLVIRCSSSEIGAGPRHVALTQLETVVTLQVGEEGKHAGITVHNGRKGVVVASVVREDVANGVLETGDVITEVNGIPAWHHRMAVHIIDECTKTRAPLSLTTYRPSKRKVCALVTDVFRACGVRSSDQDFLQKRQFTTSYYKDHDEWTLGHTTL